MVGAIIALLVVGLMLRMAYKAQYPEEKVDYDPNDGVCRCGSNTHPGFTCSRCGGEA